MHWKLAIGVRTCSYGQAGNRVKGIPNKESYRPLQPTLRGLYDAPRDRNQNGFLKLKEQLESVNHPEERFVFYLTESARMW